MKIPPPGRMVDIGGRSLHLNVLGRGGPIVILEAGIAASSLSWSLVAGRHAHSGVHDGAELRPGGIWVERSCAA